MAAKFWSFRGHKKCTELQTLEERAQLWRLPMCELALSIVDSRSSGSWVADIRIEFGLYDFTSYSYCLERGLNEFATQVAEDLLGRLVGVGDALTVVVAIFMRAITLDRQPVPVLMWFTASGVFKPSSQSTVARDHQRLRDFEVPGTRLQAPELCATRLTGGWAPGAFPRLPGPASREQHAGALRGDGFPKPPWLHKINP